MNHTTFFACLRDTHRSIGVAPGSEIGDMAPDRAIFRHRGFAVEFPTLALILALITGCTNSIATAQVNAGDAVVRSYVEIEQRENFAQLLRDYGENKILPTGFELQALLALSHYPELQHVAIRFIVDDVSIPLSSRPHWASMLHSARNRTYLVVIDNNLEGPRDVLLLKNQPFNAQIGIIGHELAHTVYYLRRSFFGILADALCQLSDCHLEFERATDRRLIDYGLGWQRYDHARFVRARFGSAQPTTRSAEGGGAYLSPDELLELIENNPVYSESHR
jgi:hypothetical protein